MHYCSDSQTLVIENDAVIGKQTQRYLDTKPFEHVRIVTNAMTCKELPVLIGASENIIIESVFHYGESQRNQLETLLDMFFNDAFPHPTENYYADGHYNILIFDALHYMNKWVEKRGAIASVTFQNYRRFIGQLKELTTLKSSNVNIFDLRPKTYFSLVKKDDPTQAATQWDKENGNWQQVQNEGFEWNGIKYDYTKGEFVDAVKRERVW